MKQLLLDVLSKYMEMYSDEKERQERLLKFLSTEEDHSLIDWNNFNGHLVAGGFLYAKKEKKFLVLYHKDLNMYLYPGGHVDSSDQNVLSAARREVIEETGIDNFEQLRLCDDMLVPIDIDTHMIGFNERLKLPEHYHFDFRYLFVVDSITDVMVDGDELGDYKWIDIDELSSDHNYGNIVVKLRRLLNDVDFKKKI